MLHQRELVLQDLWWKSHDQLPQPNNAECLSASADLRQDTLVDIFLRGSRLCEVLKETSMQCFQAPYRILTPDDVVANGARCFEYLGCIESEPDILPEGYKEDTHSMCIGISDEEQE